MQSNLSNQLESVVDHALECSAIGVRCNVNARDLSSKYYVVVLESYWGGLLPERYRDPQWLSIQSIDDQKRFWSVYAHRGCELAVRTICKVTGDTFRRERKPIDPHAETPMDKCLKKMERLDIDGLTLSDICHLFPKTPEAIVRESLLTIDAFKTWSEEKRESVYFSKARG